MNAIDLADQLKGLIGHLLGTYQRENGESYPAFVTLPLRKARPAEYKPFGLECVLLEHPRRSPGARLPGDLQLRNTWTFYLTQWPPHQGNNVEQAILVLQLHYLNRLRAEPTETVPPALSQYSISLKDEATLVECD